MVSRIYSANNKTRNKATGLVKSPKFQKSSDLTLNQGQLLTGINNSPVSIAQRKQIENVFGDTIQRQLLEEEEEEPLQGKFAAATVLQRQPSPNRTGLPDELKAGVESISGLSLDDVRVHYNSSKPAELQALAYTQGTDIHIAPGQERHLPHEAWHVVQQKQGRVKPTVQLNGNVPVNDDHELEREADERGMKALQQKNASLPRHMSTQVPGPTLQRMTARIRHLYNRTPTAAEIAEARATGRANSARLAGHGRAPHGRRTEVPSARQEQQAEADRRAAEERAIQLKRDVSINIDVGVEKEADVMEKKLDSKPPEISCNGAASESKANTTSIVQPVLDIQSSPQSPIHVLKYRHYKSLTHKGRMDVPIPSWINLRKMALSKRIYKFANWREAVAAAKDYAGDTEPIKSREISIAENEVKIAEVADIIKYPSVTSCMTITLVLTNGKKVGGHIGLYAGEASGVITKMKTATGSVGIRAIRAKGHGSIWGMHLENTETLRPTIRKEFLQRHPNGNFDTIGYEEFGEIQGTLSIQNNQKEFRTWIATQFGSAGIVEYQNASDGDLYIAADGTFT
jgi:hypothetical protein